MKIKQKIMRKFRYIFFNFFSRSLTGKQFSNYKKYISSYRNVIACGSVLLSREDKTLIPNYFWHKEWAMVGLKAFDYIRCYLACFFGSNISTLENVVVFYHPYKMNYFHFLFELLLNAEYCRDEIKGIDNCHFFFGRANKPHRVTNWQKQYFSLLDYDLSKLVMPDKPVLFKNVIVINNSKINNDAVKIELLHKFSRKLVEKVNDCNTADLFLSSEKIYVSRKFANSRRLENENELFSELKKEGFIKVYLEKMSLLEQIMLFSIAKIVVAPHGAGNTNIIFSNNATLIELFVADSQYRDYYMEICKMLNFPYIKVFSNEIISQSASFSVDVEEVLNKVRNACNA